MAQFSRSQINNLTSRIIAAAIEVHRHLGPGLLEGLYQRCMQRELTAARLPFEAEKVVDVVYKGTKLDLGLRLDLVIGGLVVV